MWHFSKSSNVLVQLEALVCLIKGSTKKYKLHTHNKTIIFILTPLTLTNTHDSQEIGLWRIIYNFTP